MASTRLSSSLRPELSTITSKRILEGLEPFLHAAVPAQVRDTVGNRLAAGEQGQLMPLGRGLATSGLPTKRVPHHQDLHGRPAKSAAIEARSCRMDPPRLFAMEIIPAIDLLEGACVRLHQDYDQVTRFSDDPVAQPAAGRPRAPPDCIWWISTGPGVVSR